MLRFRDVLLLLALWVPSVPAQESVPEIARDKLAEADRHREAGRVEDAEERYREVLELAPSLIDAYVGLGAIYHQSRDYERALASFTAGLERFPEEPTLLFNAAATEMRLGNMERSLAFADRCIAVNGDDVAVHSLRGTILRRLQRFDEALAALEKVTELDGSNVRAFYNLGNVHYELGRKQDALAAYRKAIRIDKAYQPAHYNLGAVLFELQQYDEALEEYEVALAPVEKDFERGKPVAAAHARAYSNLGAIYLRRQSWDRALDAYLKAVSLDSEDAAAHYNVGYIQFELGRKSDAYEAYSRAVALDSELPLSYLHMGLIDFENGRMKQAVHWLGQGLPLFSPEERRQAVLALGQAQHALGDSAGAQQSYRELLELDGANVTALIGLGRILRQEGQLAEARGYLERAGTSVLDSSGVAIELAALARAEGDTGRERALYEEVLRRDGQRAEMWPVRVNLISVLMRMGAMDDALRESNAVMRQLELIAASSPEVARQLRTTHAVLMARRGSLAEARTLLDSVVREDAAFVPAINAMAAIDAATGNVDRAASSWAALVARSDGTDFAVHANLGQALWLGGRLDEAREHLLVAAEAFPSNALIRGALGEIALAGGDHAGAIRELEAAVQSCSSPSASSTPSVDLIYVGGEADACERFRGALGVSLVAAAETKMSNRRPEARRQLEQALAYPLDGRVRARALFMRGTLALLDGEVTRARGDLEQALQGPLAAELVASAQNNLGVALHRSGDVRQARLSFERARANVSRHAAATLNLAIVFHDAKEREQALALYEEYLALDGARRQDAMKWAESIRRVYR